MRRFAIGAVLVVLATGATGARADEEVTGTILVANPASSGGANAAEQAFHQSGCQMPPAPELQGVDGYVIDMGEMTKGPIRLIPASSLASFDAVFYSDRCEFAGRLVEASPTACSAGDGLVVPKECHEVEARFAIVSMIAGASEAFTFSWG